MPIELSQPEVIDLPLIDASGVENHKRWVDLGLVLLISFSPAIFAATVIWLSPGSDAAIWSAPRFMSGIMREVTCLLLLMYVLSRQHRSLSSIGLNIRWRDPFIALGLAITALFVGAIQTGMIARGTLLLFGHPADMRHPDMTSGAPVLLLLSYGIMAGIFEETLVRGYLMTELIALGKPVWLATIVSIALQTSYHVYYGFAGALSISSIFIVFAIYFAFSRRLFPVILAHAFWDVMTVLIKLHR